MGIGDSILSAFNPITPFHDAQDLATTAVGILGDKSADLGAPVRFYGNWGGPGYGGDKAPRDGLDTAFMNHDKGYGAHGYFDTATDVVFFNESALNALRPGASHRERLYGAVATGIFAGMVPISSHMTSVVNPIINSKGDPVKAAVGIATAPVTTAVNATVGTVKAVANFVGGLFGW